MLARLQQDYEIHYRLRADRLTRLNKGLCQDAAVLAAHEILGMGPKRCIDFILRYNEILRELGALIDEEYADQGDCELTKERLDRTMRQIYELPGEEHWMPPFDQRMGLVDCDDTTVIDIPERQWTDRMRARVAAEKAKEDNMRRGTLAEQLRQAEENEKDRKRAEKPVKLDSLEGLANVDLTAPEPEEDDTVTLRESADRRMVNGALSAAYDKPQAHEHHHKPRKGGKRK